MFHFPLPRLLAVGDFVFFICTSTNLLGLSREIRDQINCHVILDASGRIHSRAFSLQLTCHQLHAQVIQTVNSLRQKWHLLSFSNMFLQALRRDGFRDGLRREGIFADMWSCDVCDHACIEVRRLRLNMHFRIISTNMFSSCCTLNGLCYLIRPPSGDP